MKKIFPLLLLLLTASITFAGGRPQTTGPAAKGTLITRDMPAAQVRATTPATSPAQMAGSSAAVSLTEVTTRPALTQARVHKLDKTTSPGTTTGAGQKILLILGLILLTALVMTLVIVIGVAMLVTLNLAGILVLIFGPILVLILFFVLLIAILGSKSGKRTSERRQRRMERLFANK